MAIAIRGKNIEITPALKEYVEKRVGKIAKYFEAANEINVALAVIKNHHIVEVTAQINGLLLRGEESSADMYTSIDLVVEKIEKQIEKYKTKLSRKLRLSAFKTEAITPPEDRAGEQTVVKTKRFAIKPMDVEEAIMQMNLIHHDFYVFTNAETEQANVIYRRKDGQYGLIEPEI